MEVKGKQKKIWPIKLQMNLLVVKYMYQQIMTNVKSYLAIIEVQNTIMAIRHCY